MSEEGAAPEFTVVGGYATAEVDAYVGGTQAALTRLREQVERHTTESERARQREQAVLDAEQSLVELLDMAEATIQRTVDEAKASAARLVADAEHRAGAMLAEARAHVAATYAEARAALTAEFGRTEPVRPPEPPPPPDHVVDLTRRREADVAAERVPATDRDQQGPWRPA